METMVATSIDTVCMHVSFHVISPEPMSSDETGFMAPGLVNEIRL